MEANETHVDTSEFYDSALDNLMDTLHANSTHFSQSSTCNNSLRKHTSSGIKDKFFSFCSTAKKYSNTDSSCRDKTGNVKQNDATNKSPTQTAEETPKRPVATTRKQKLFGSTESIDEIKSNSISFFNKELSVYRDLLLKKANAQEECVKRSQESIKLKKKPMRTSLRI